MKKSKRAATALAAAGLLLSTLAPGVALATDSDGPGGSVAGDACAELGFDWQEKWEFRGATYARDGGTSYLESVTGTKTAGSFVAADGYLVGHVFVKGGDANDGGNAIDPPSASSTFNNSAVPEAGNSGSAAGISNVVFCGSDAPDEDPEYFVEFTKTWAGDDIGFGDHDVTFIVNGDDWNIGDPAAPVELGDKLTVTEETTSLPEGCEYITDLDSPITIIDDGSDHDGLFTIDVTNTVDCDEPVEDPEYSVEFTKTWAGDDIGFGDHDVTFIVNGDDWNIGDPATSVEIGDKLTVTEETTSLPEGCEYTTDLDSPITIVDDGSDHDGLLTIDVTNTVDCAEVEGVVIEKPKTPPHTTPVVTGKTPVAPVVTGKATVTPVVTGKATVAPVEVKGVSMTAGDQEMPRTGVPALLLSLMGMAALGTGGMMVRRRP